MRQFPKLFLVTVWLILSCSLAEAGRYTDNKDGTITDSENALMWQKSDDSVERIWNDAVTYCDELKLAGHEDWMLPDIQMLENLIDNTFSPTVDPVFSVRLSYYWSGTEARESVSSAKYINFFYGNTYSFIKDNTYYAICVRDISESQTESMKVAVKSVLTTLSAPFTVQFAPTISGGSEPYFFEWDFGDGEFSSLSKLPHTYVKSGDYHVVVTVTDNDGAIAVGREELTLNEPQEIKPTLTSIDVEGSVVAPVPDSNVTLDDNETVDDNSTMVVESPVAEAVIVPPVVDKSIGTPSIEGETILETDNGVDETGGIAPLDDNGTEMSDDHDIPKDDGALQTSTEAGIDVGVSTPEEVGGKDDNSSGVNHGFLKMFASDGASLSRLPGVNEGLLAYSFNNGLRGDADWNKDGKVTARELKGYLGTAIETLSQGKEEAVMDMSEGDFQVCAEAGVTHIMAVGVDMMNEEGSEGVFFAAQSAQAIGRLIAEKCPSWKQLVLIGKETARNNVIRALLKMRREVSSHDNFIFYYAGRSEGSEQGLNLFTYDTLSELPGMTGLDYEELTGLLDESEAGNIIMLFEVGAHVQE